MHNLSKYMFDVVEYSLLLTYKGTNEVVGIRGFIVYTSYNVIKLRYFFMFFNGVVLSRQSGTSVDQDEMYCKHNKHMSQ